MTTIAAAASALLTRQQQQQQQQAPSEIVLRYEPWGGAAEMWTASDLEVCLDGPAGTGKTVAALQKLHRAMGKYPGAKGFITRKTNVNLTGSALATFREFVLHPAEGVRFFSGSRERPAGYMYPNGTLDPRDPYAGGSFLAVFGMDKADKVKSWEFDRGYVNEATEITLEDLEFLRSRMRHGATPYHQIVMDTNPGPPAHWLNQRMNDGHTRRVLSRHTDNPRYWDRERGDWTAEGRVYVEDILGGLTGVRKRRLLDGVWAAAEGGVYEDYYDAALHLLDRAVVSKRPTGREALLGDCGLPREWPRYLVVDFGHTNPFVAQWWAEDGDGRLYRYRELYMTKRMVEHHARQIREVSRWGQDGGDPLPRAVICDHDAEGRATLEWHLGLVTTPAKKDVIPGIEAVQSRMIPAGEPPRPRVLLLRGSLIERDDALAQRKLPCCTEEEIDGYVWDTSMGRKTREDVVKENDHGADAMRYMVAHKDLRRGVVQTIEKTW